jgi:hypothetical protein
LVNHYHSKNYSALKRVRDILTGEILGHWGAPDKESLEKYEKAVNFSFKKFYEDSDFLRKIIEETF